MSIRLNNKIVAGSSIATDEVVEGSKLTVTSGGVSKALKDFK